jgi:hypothetical protein
MVKNLGMFCLHDNSIHLNDLKKSITFYYYVSLNDNHSVINFNSILNKVRNNHLIKIEVRIENRIILEES